MRSLFLALACLILLPVATARSQPTRGPERTGTIVKNTPATEEEKKQGVLALLVVKDGGKEVLIPIQTDTRLWISSGKVGEVGKATDFKVGDPVSVWLKKDAEGKAKTEQVMAFRPGQPDLPPR